MRIFIVSIVASVSAMFLGGCASTTIDTSVNSYAAGVPQAGTTYAIIPYTNGQEDVEMKLNSFEFNEYANLLEKSFSSKGWSRLPANSQPHMVVVVSYGMGPPNTRQYQYSVPTYGKTGSNSYTTGTVTSFGGFTNLNATTTTIPTYGITGSETRLGTITTYDRWLGVSAIDWAEYSRTGKLNRVFDVAVKSTGTGGDLRAVMPYMAMSAGRYAGVNSGRAIMIEHKYDGKEIREFLNSPMPERQLPAPVVSYREAPVTNQPAEVQHQAGSPSQSQTSPVVTQGKPRRSWSNGVRND